MAFLCSLKLLLSFTRLQMDFVVEGPGSRLGPSLHNRQTLGEDFWQLNRV